MRIKKFTALFGGHRRFSGPSLKLLAAAPDSNGVMQLQVTGIGTATCTHASSIYAPDKDGIYQAFSTNKPIWGGGRYVDEDHVYNTESDGTTLLSPQPYLLYMPALTNDQIRSNDLADAEWTASNVAIGDQDETGITGDANTACTLTATAGNGTVIANAITAASDTHATAWHIKRKTGTGTIELTVDGGTTWQDITSSISASFSRIAVDQATVTNPQIGIRIVTSGDAVIVGNAESHLTKALAEVRGASPIFTTTAAASTDRTEYQFDIANHSDVSGAYFLEAAIERGDVAVAIMAGAIISSNTVSQADLLYWQSGVDRFRSFDGSTSTTLGNTGLTSSISKFSVVYDTVELTQRIGRDGVYSSEVAYDGSWENSVGIGIFVGADYPQKMRSLMRWQGGTYTQLKAKVAELMV